MDIRFRIGRKHFFFARARARIVRSASAVLFSVLATIRPGLAQDPEFIIGNDSQKHGIVLDHSPEKQTRSTMGVSPDCDYVRKQPKALPMVASEGAWINPHVTSHRGVMLLEGLRPGKNPKLMDTEFLGQYKNYPATMRAETQMMPGSRYPLCLIITAAYVGEGDLVFQKGDYVIVHADGQLFAYKVPEITIPSEGVLRFYLGTDDTLYYNSELTHPVHAGRCGRKAL
jgi:hypothetical protein